MNIPHVRVFNFGGIFNFQNAKSVQVIFLTYSLYFTRSVFSIMSVLYCGIL